MNDFVKEIERELTLYTGNVQKNVEKAAKKTATEAVRELKKKSPKLTGAYAESWAKKKIGKGFIIHNKKHYQLTHLLEHGHAKRGGGRVKAYPHISKVEKNAIKEFTEKVEKVVKEG